MNPALVALVVVLALTVSTGGGWAVTRLVLHLASRSSDAGEPLSGPDGAVLLRGKLVESDGPDGARAQAVLRGGTWVGLLERLATTGALIVGEPTAVAVVVAVKGLGRYPELRENPGASERFVIGTFASLLWAASIGLLARWLLAR